MSKMALPVILHKIQPKCNTSRFQNSMDKINVKTVMIISNRLPISFPNFLGEKRMFKAPTIVYADI